MNGVRKNTLVVDLSVLPVRPDAGKVQHFLENDIELNLADVKSIQLHNTRNCVYIEMVDPGTALRYEKAHNIKRSIVCKGKPFKIPVYVDSEAVTVRVHDLPPSIPHKTVGDYMMRFGDVISIQNERWKKFFPGVFNGVRVLQMRLKQSIPSFITIEGETAMVLHSNQTRTCRYCFKAVHPNQKCLEVAATSDVTPTTTSTIPSTSTKLNEADFPPMSPPTPPSPGAYTEVVANDRPSLSEHETRTASLPTDITAVQTKQQNSIDDDNDDDGDSSESSPCETDDGSNKRRLSTKRSNEKKKICADLRSQNNLRSK